MDRLASRENEDERRALLQDGRLRRRGSGPVRNTIPSSSLERSEHFPFGFRSHGRLRFFSESNEDSFGRGLARAFVSTTSMR